MSNEVRIRKISPVFDGDICDIEKLQHLEKGEEYWYLFNKYNIFFGRDFQALGKCDYDNNKEVYNLVVYKGTGYSNKYVLCPKHCAEFEKTDKFKERIMENYFKERVECELNSKYFKKGEK